MPKPIAAAALLLAIAPCASAADLSCNGLVPSGSSLICAGFEPNWAVELSCSSGAMRSTFIDGFSGDAVRSTAGTITFSSRDPWTFETSHPVKGTIARTPSGCTDESGARRNYTFTPTAAPGLHGPLRPFCCRVR
jgi:hypothetical protein